MDAEVTALRETTSDAVTAAFHPVYLRMMLALAARQGVGANTTLPIDLKRPIDLVSAQRLISGVLTHSQNARLGLHFGREIQLHAHGEVGLAALTAATWQEAFATLARFGAQRVPVLDFELDAEAASLHVRARQPLGDIHAFVFDALAAVVDQLGAALLGAPAEALVHHLPYPMPFATEAYSTSLAGQVRFDARDGYRVTWPHTFARRACVTADAEAHARAVAVCVRAQDRSAHGEISARVRHLLAANNGSWPTAEHIAAQLHLSTRSLFRHLAAEGSSFQTLCDGARIEQARFLLIETGLPVSAIAERLGYADTSNFARSFRRLSATTPIAFRRAHRGRR